MVRVLLVAVLAVLVCEGWWLVSQRVALALGSSWCVYFLVDRKGAVLYVGQTNDRDRRLAEHMDPDEPGEWRRRIVDMATVRWCWSQRQSKRVERRMIRALVDGGRVRMCDRINNLALVKPSAFPSVTRLGWLIVYRLHGSLMPVCRWHGPNPVVRCQEPPQRIGTPLHGQWDEAVTPDQGSGGLVIAADSPQEAPLGAPQAGDMSPDADGGDTTPVPARPTLSVVPALDGDDLPSDPDERRRERNRRNQAARRARLAEQRAAE